MTIETAYCKQETDLVSDLAQKQFSDDGHSGNLYRQNPETVAHYEDLAMELIEKEG